MENKPENRKRSSDKQQEKEQLEHRLNRAKNRADYLADKERRARTRRLIQRGGAIESLLPEVRGLSEKAFYSALEDYFGKGSHRKDFLACAAKARNREGL